MVASVSGKTRRRDSGPPRPPDRAMGVRGTAQNLGNAMEARGKYDLRLGIEATGGGEES